MVNELSIPEAVSKDLESFELLRVWVAESGQHVTLLPGVWEDPAAWGIMLADVARHAANTYRESAGLNWQEVILRIRAGWDAELDQPTDKPSGQIS